MTVNIAELLQRANDSILDVARSIPTQQPQIYNDKVPLLQKILSDLAELIASKIPDEECQKLAAARWPSGLSLLKFLPVVQDKILELKDIAKRLYEQGPSHPSFFRAFLLARLLLPPTGLVHPDPFGQHSGLARSLWDYRFEVIPFVDQNSQEDYAALLQDTVEKAMHVLETYGPIQPECLALIESYMSSFSDHRYYMTDAKILPLMKLRNTVLRRIGSRLCPTLSCDYQPPARDLNRRIRIGILLKTFMSGGETWAAQANISALDRNKYEIILLCFDFSTGYTHDVAYYREMLSCVDRIVAVPSQDVEASVRCIRGLEVDILWHQTHLGLSELGSTPLIFAYRLAQIQIADFCMHAFTTGNPYYTHFFGIEPLIDGREWRDEFFEKYMYGKGIHIFIPDAWDEPPNFLFERRDLGIVDDAVVYFIGASIAKYARASFDLWLRVLKKVSNAVLVLYPSNPAWSPKPDQVLTFHALIDKAVKASGVDPARIKILPHVNGQAIAHMHAWGDVYLSSYPYGGVTSLSDALRGGLCPVSAACQSARGCGEAPILEGYGLLDLMARTEEAYEDLAVRLGLDAAYRAEIKERVRTAWATRRDGMKEAIARERAALIDEVAKGLVAP